MPQSFLDCLRDETALRLEAGARSVDVQSDLIDSASGLTEDERAALWLFAWAYRPSTARQRADARRPVVG